MEKSVNFEFRDLMEEMLQFDPVDVSAYDLIIKSMVINQGNRQVQKLHRETSGYVQASAQSFMMRAMQEHLTEEEHAVYKRGRNAKSVSPAKNQSIIAFSNTNIRPVYYRLSKSNGI